MFHTEHVIPIDKGTLEIYYRYIVRILPSAVTEAGC